MINLDSTRTAIMMTQTRKDSKSRSPNSLPVRRWRRLQPRLQLLPEIHGYAFLLLVGQRQVISCAFSLQRSPVLLPRHLFLEIFGLLFLLLVGLHQVAVGLAVLFKHKLMLGLGSFHLGLMFLLQDPFALGDLLDICILVCI